MGMSSNQINRSLEQILKIPMQRTQDKNLRGHIHQYVHIAVRTIVAACHRSEQA